MFSLPTLWQVGYGGCITPWLLTRTSRAIMRTISWLEPGGSKCSGTLRRMSLAICREVTDFQCPSFWDGFWHRWDDANGASREGMTTKQEMRKAQKLILHPWLKVCRDTKQQTINMISANPHVILTSIVFCYCVENVSGWSQSGIFEQSDNQIQHYL